MLVDDTILKALEKITGTDEVRKNLDLDLFGERVLDSLGTVELIVALSEQLGIEVTPGEIDRELWATPRKIIEYFRQRVDQR
jgi:D-alanine--poly(phosphoribitol) ligase subunit 2